MKQKFPLSYVVLYAKGWYKKSDDVFTDLKTILEFEDYTPFSSEDVYNILLRNYQKAFNIDMINFLSDISINNCWKISYFPKKNYDIKEAVVYKIMSDLRFLNPDKWDVKIPKYSKKINRNPSISINDIYLQFSINKK